jgi:hypothetical protein
MEDTCSPSYSQARICRIWFKPYKISARPYLKQTKSKRTGGMSQVVEFWFSKLEALSSFPSTTERGQGGGIGVHASQEDNKACAPDHCYQGQPHPLTLKSGPFYLVTANLPNMSIWHQLLIGHVLRTRPLCWVLGVQQ